MITSKAMNTIYLFQTAQALVAGDKGILAMDESSPSCNKRFAALGIPQTEEVRRAYREMILTTPQLGECISEVNVKAAQHALLGQAKCNHAARRGQYAVANV